MLEVRLHSFVNGLHVAVSNRGYCCDNEDEDSPLSNRGCTDPCDNYFVFCLRDLGASCNEFVNLTYCSRSNRIQTGLLETNNDNLMFTIGQPFPKSPHHSEVSNPVRLHGSNWNVSVSLIV